MKHLLRFNALILIALTGTLVARGGVSVPVTQGTDGESASKPYSVSVSAGQDMTGQASANLTISGGNSKVSVEKQGTVTLVAGQSIILRPGTRVSAGGFLYASIEPKGKPGKNHKKSVSVVTIEEMKRIQEQASLAVAYTLFRPFPVQRQGTLAPVKNPQGSFTQTTASTFGVSPENQRTIGPVHRSATPVARTGIPLKVNSATGYVESRPETTRVLRL